MCVFVRVYRERERGEREREFVLGSVKLGGLLTRMAFMCCWSLKLNSEWRRGRERGEKVATRRAARIVTRWWKHTKVVWEIKKSNCVEISDEDQPTCNLCCYDPFSDQHNLRLQKATVVLSPTNCWPSSQSTPVALRTLSISHSSISQCHHPLVATTSFPAYSPLFSASAKCQFPLLST